MATRIGIELGMGAVRAVVVERASRPPLWLRHRDSLADPPAAGAPARSRAGPAILRAAEEVPCETGNPDALTRALSHLRSSLRLNAPVVLGLPGTAAILTTVHPLIASPRKALLGVQFELQQQLPFDLGETVWHFQWLAGQNGHAAEGPGGGERGAVVAAMRASLLEERLACCRRAGLAVRAVTLTALASLNACRAGAAAADQPERVTLLRCVPDEPMAEWLVWTPAGVQVVPVTGTSMDAFWQELAASAAALRAQGVVGAGPVWVVGPAAAIEPLQRSVGQAGLDLQPVNLRELVEPEGAAGDDPGRWAAAAGLALQGFGAGPVRLNLLARRQERARAERTTRTAAIVSAVCAVAIAGLGLNGMLEVSHRQLRTLRALERAERQYQELRPEIRALMQQQQQTQQRLLQLEQLMNESPALIRLFAQIADALPDEVWLTSLECAKEGLAASPAGAQPGTVTGLVEGRAKSFQDVTRLLDRLKGLPGMQAVKPLSTNILADDASSKELIAFAMQLDCRLREAPEAQ